MAKLKLGAIASDKPVKPDCGFASKCPSGLAAYADLLARETSLQFAEYTLWCERPLMARSGRWQPFF